jgi:hypothetical protein
MIIKSTFSNRIFDWVVVCLTFSFLVLSFLNLFSDYQYIHSELLSRIIFLFLSLNAFISFFLPKVNGERTTHLFIGGVLIIPSVFPLFQFIVELIFNQTFLLDSINTPFLYFKLILGVLLLFLSIKFTKKRKSKRVKDLGIFLTGLGFYVLLYLLLRAVESIVKSTTVGFDLWEIIVKVVLGISIIITGLQIRYRKLGYSMGLILITLVFILFFAL